MNEKEMTLMKFTPNNTFKRYNKELVKFIRREVNFYNRSMNKDMKRVLFGLMTGDLTVIHVKQIEIQKYKEHS